MLTNKENYGHYYGRYGRHISWVNRELIEMNLKPATMNIVHDIVSENIEENRKEGKRLRKRNVQLALESLSKRERKLFTDMNQAVHGLDISSLQGQMTIPEPPAKRKRQSKTRPFRINHEN